MGTTRGRRASRPTEALGAGQKRKEIAGGTVAGAHLRVGEVAKEVVGLAEELEIDLIVVGTRGRGVIGRALMGSVSDSVVRHARCPVVVARSQEIDGKRTEDPRPGSPPWGTGKGEQRVECHTMGYETRSSYA